VPRRYIQQRRAEQQEETKARIVEAAVELHNTVGPAHTTDRAIAERAGVTRRTFYRHFPTDVDLFRACTTHATQKWPPPDPATWRGIRDPQERLRRGLGELYAYYRATGDGLAAILRDGPFLRSELTNLPSRGDVLRTIPAVLMEGWNVRDRTRAILAAAIVHATSVSTWQSLVGRQALTQDEAVSLLVGMVTSAAGPKSKHRTPGGRQRAENHSIPRSRSNSAFMRSVSMK
jgi:AcrR family transcriptional regulator